mmetsp:Transcript_106867/g.309140  ORF Transcript_106867/g.309140 Transcript_106867/m.309140 type:complete len:206 (-) Transcript_106867:2479-3096(-)
MLLLGLERRLSGGFLFDRVIGSFRGLRGPRCGLLFLLLDFLPMQLLELLEFRLHGLVLLLHLQRLLLRGRKLLLQLLRHLGVLLASLLLDLSLALLLLYPRLHLLQPGIRLLCHDRGAGAEVEVPLGFQHDLDFLPQDLRVKWLGHEVGRASGEALDRSLIHRGLRGDHDDRHLAVLGLEPLPDLLAHLEAIHPRHLDIKQHRVG